jgi:LmbE family N-acetylglucosaminyl deacetylase
MLRLMCVTAHPDDEAGGFGGTLPLYHDRGVQTSVICLTPGQAATHRGDAKTDQELAEMRRKEFARACEILKVTRGEVLDYPDGKLHRQELYNVVCELTRYVREIRPQVMITFGPEGGFTGHTDHSMAGLFASLAFQWAGRTNRYPDQLSGGMLPHRVQKLYYGAPDGALPGRQPITFPPISAIIEIGKYMDTKLQAFSAHTSQAPLLPLFRESVLQRQPQELFHLVATLQSGPETMEHDLFAGVKDDG